MNPGLLVTVFALGFGGAFVSGLVGIGGAILMIPLLYYVPPLVGVGSLDFKQVAGVTMVQVLAAAVSGAVTHAQGPFLHRRLAVAGGAAMAAGSLVGSVGSHFVTGRVLMAVFAGMTTLALPLMLLAPVDLGAAGGADAPPSVPRAVVFATLIGVVSGLVGAGGAFLLVPVLVGVVRLPMRSAIATSLAMTSVSAVAGFAGKALTGQVAAGPALAVVAGSLAGAPLGARLSRRAPVALLRGILVALIALVMIDVWAEVLLR